MTHSELTYDGLQRDLTHARGIFESLIGSEQNLLGEKHFSKFIWGQPTIKSTSLWA